MKPNKHQALYTKKLTQIELPQKAGILHLAKVHRQNIFLEQIQILHLEGTAVRLEANDLAENLTTGHARQLPITGRVGRHGIVQHSVQLEREEGGGPSSGDEYRRGGLLCGCAIGRGRGHLGVVVVVVLDELADVAVFRDLALQLDLRGRGRGAALTSGARGVRMLVGHENVAKGRRRMSRLGFVGNSTGDRHFGGRT